MSLQVLIQRGPRIVASARVDEETGRVSDWESSNEVWAVVIRALAPALQQVVAPDELRAWARTQDNRAGARRYLATHCKHGHELTPDNLYYIETSDQGQVRRCRECVRIRERARYRMKVIRRWHGPCPSCGGVHNPADVADSCIDAMAEAIGDKQAIRKSRVTAA